MAACIDTPEKRLFTDTINSFHKSNEEWDILGTVMLSRVKNTRKMLRQHIIETILNEFDEQCIELTREQRKEKYKKMMESPFRFFRGKRLLILL